MTAVTAPNPPLAHPPAQRRAVGRLGSNGRSALSTRTRTAQATGWLLASLAVPLAPTALAQSGDPAAAPTPAAGPPAPATRSAAPDPRAEDTAVLPAVRATARGEPSGKDSLRATTTRLGKGEQALRDVPQSITVITEKLLDDRALDTLKDALRTTGGVAFQAAEGTEEDIRLRGFSLQASGDIFLDGLRDPAFYERDSFNWDRLELLRGSASVLFGRGSTGGAVNQVSKQPGLVTQHEVTGTLGSGSLARATADLNWKTGRSSALRVNAMATQAEGDGVPVDKRGLALAFRQGIGERDEFSIALLKLDNDNGIDYGLPWLPPGQQGGGGVWPRPPGAYYGMASDFNRTGTTQWTASHLHRFADRSEWRTVLRLSNSDRDQRASAIRFAPAARQPDGQAVTADRFGDATVLTRGTNLKTMALATRALQSDYSGRHTLGGRVHALQTGVDLAQDRFDNFGASLPPGVALTKPSTTVGTPDDGARVDEGQRRFAVNRRFAARSVGVYAQDLIELTPTWKLLAGTRWDRLDGRYENLTVAAPATNPCALQPAREMSRRDALWSHRAGLLWQPSATQSFHAAWGTSFNTSGDTYQYDAGTAQTAPEKSRNLELGARLDAADGRLSTRAALFHSTKYNERNRDADSVNACNYVLSGERHAAGLEFDLSGRIGRAWEVWGSYAWIPVARVDASSGAAGTEPVGARPGLTPRHSGSLWAAYKIDAHWRVGAGLNARSSDRPTGLAATSPVVAPRFVTADLLAEYRRGDLRYQLNLTNLTDAHTADTLYRGHYVPGKPRTLQLTAGYAFF